MRKRSVAASSVLDQIVLIATSPARSQLSYNRLRFPLPSDSMPFALLHRNTLRETAV